MTKNDIPYLDRLRVELTRAVQTQGVGEQRTGRHRLRGRPMLVAGAATAAVAATISAFVFLGGEADPGPAPSQAATTPQPTTPPTGGGGLSQCVSQATPETLRERGYALDGTIVEVTVPEDEGAPTEITVQVERWYQGGEAATAVLRTYSRPGVVSLEGGEVPLVVGTRILASGDDGFLWDCGGYSMEYSEDGRRLFEEAFGD